MKRTDWYLVISLCTIVLGFALKNFLGTKEVPNSILWGFGIAGCIVLIRNLDFEFALKSTQLETSAGNFNINSQDIKEFNQWTCIALGGIDFLVNIKGTQGTIFCLKNDLNKFGPKSYALNAELRETSASELLPEMYAMIDTLKPTPPYYFAIGPIITDITYSTDENYAMHITKASKTINMLTEQFEAVSDVRLQNSDLAKALSGDKSKVEQALEAIKGKNKEEE